MRCLPALAALLLAASPALAQDSDTEERAETLAALEVFAQAFALTRDNYVEGVDDASLIESALNGALSHLDPHSGYVPPADFEERLEDAKREYGGLGIEITQRDGLVHVNYAIESGPAYRSGIRAGDFITHVAGDSVLGKDLDSAVEGMRGPVGEPVTVTVLTGDGPARDVVVVRETVRGRVVRHSLEEGVPYAFLQTFNNERLTDDLREALKDLERQKGGRLPGLILDLRSNRGGLLEQSVSVSGLFLDGGEVLSVRGREDDDIVRYHAEEGELYPDMPIVVLINSGSASAAEIVAGALQDRGRAVVLGRRSFGKGSVQSVIQLPPYGQAGALRLTTERYFTPSGKSIQGRGIMPDVLVSLLPDNGELRDRFREDSLPYALSNLDDPTEYQERYEDVEYPPEDWEEGEDYQLHRAIRLINNPSIYRSLLTAQDAEARTQRISQASTVARGGQAGGG